MVAKVIAGKNIKGALNYNEHKVREGKATCISASGFLQDAEEMTFYDKLHRFEHLIAQNRRTELNTLHISLNFDVSEKLPENKLCAIADTYMTSIGFGDQPYLVYQHFDAAHPHLHIVTTNIKEDGGRIDFHNIGRNASEEARNLIEKEFGLVQAQSKPKKEQQFVRPIDVQKVTYGKSETKRSISNAVRMVTHSYKYTSLPELNAILRQYNVMADRGREGTQMFDKKGLLYSLVDDKGKRIGIPVKASAIYGKPTLPFLERQFHLNEALRQPYKAWLKDTVERVLQTGSNMIEEQFADKLSKQGINVVFRTNEEGRTYGVTFVDNKNKTVFNGSDLGKPYSAKSILERLATRSSANDHFRPGFSKIIMKPSDGKKDGSSALGFTNVVDNLFNAETPYTISAEAALRLKKRKKRSL
ncbi:MAG TPA: relaxase/mobilization nuclease domain-containing protein [Ohtaekwangia sp.]|nr:relaxase/mobilization nuclease domain-containing protein [Ohtaekwangia sp.]